MSIHPTAIVDPGAKLGEGVQIGAYAIVGPSVEIGDGSIIDPHAIVMSHVRMGKECRVFPFASIGGPPQDLKWKGEETWVEIGDKVVMREYVTVNRGTAQGGGLTSVGTGSFLMGAVHVAHDCHIGERVIMANAALLAGHVEIANGAIIGGGAAVHQFVRIGELAMVGAMSGVPLDVPPFVNAVVPRPLVGNALHGLNLIGLKRAGISYETISALKEAFTILFREKLPMQDAVAKVEAEVPQLPQVVQLLDFLKTTKRGVLLQ